MVKKHILPTLLASQSGALSRLGFRDFQSHKSHPLIGFSVQNYGDLKQIKSDNGRSRYMVIHGYIHGYATYISDDVFLYSQEPHH